RFVASYARRIPSTTCLLASPLSGAVAHTIAVSGVLPLAEIIGNPPGIPPVPPIPAEATSALLARNEMFPALSIFHARRHSFSPHTNSMGPSVGLLKYAGLPCR